MARAWTMLAIGGAALVMWQCSNGATGVEACRKIENKKCELALGCANAPRVADEGDVTACKLFYRDQCLLGMADSADPTEVQTDACLAALDAAGGCKGGALAKCAAAPKLVTGADPKLLSGCDVILANEKLADCAFLQPPPGTTTSAGGGLGGQGGAGTGGAGGAGGGSAASTATATATTATTAGATSATATTGSGGAGGA
jgi:hypothetical protein